MSGDSIAELVWAEQHAWSMAASREKAKIANARLAALIITVAVAVLGATAAGVGADRALGKVVLGLAALGAAVVPLLQRVWAGGAVQAWLRMRSVSEGLKSEVHLWLVRAGAYTDDLDGAALERRADEITEGAKDLLRHRSEGDTARRALPDVRSAETYFRRRVADQIDNYYSPRADTLKRRLRTFRRLQSGLAVLAAILGGVAAATGADVGAWIAVMTTIGTALALHVAAQRYEYQLVEFLQTAAELRRISRAAAATTDASELRNLIDRAEGVISVENQAWMVKLGEEAPG